MKAYHQLEEIRNEKKKRQWQCQCIANRRMKGGKLMASQLWRQ